MRVITTTHTCTHTNTYVRLFWADEPVSRPGPARRWFEALFGQSDSSCDITELWACQACSSPTAHKGKAGLVLVLWENTACNVAFLILSVSFCIDFSVKTKQYKTKNYNYIPDLINFSILELSVITVSAKTDSFPSAYSLKCLTSAANPNQILTLSCPGSLASPPLLWGYCKTSTPQVSERSTGPDEKLLVRVCALRKMVCSCPQCLPECSLEKRTVCAGMRW